VPGGPTYQRLSLPYFFAHARGLLLEPPDPAPPRPGLATGQAPPSTSSPGPSPPISFACWHQAGPLLHSSFALVQNAAERPPSPLSPLRTSSSPSSCARQLPHSPAPPSPPGTRGPLSTLELELPLQTSAPPVRSSPLRLFLKFSSVPPSPHPPRAAGAHRFHRHPPELHRHLETSLHPPSMPPPCRPADSMRYRLVHLARGVVISLVKLTSPAMVSGSHRQPAAGSVTTCG
jgi:hypothetical protein